jgi:mannose-6-phosphate isomerase class I
MYITTNMNSSYTSPNQAEEIQGVKSPSRKSTQFLMPQHLNLPTAQDTYNIYPFQRLGGQRIFNGFDSLSDWIAEKGTVIIDGYGGGFYDEIKEKLNNCFSETGLSVNWIETKNFLKSEEVIDAMIGPFMGQYGSVWGTKCLLNLEDFFYTDKLTAEAPDANSDINIVFGSGAAFCSWDVPLIYIDIPKNEIQFRMRAGSITNLGSTKQFEHFYMYKRFYFVDWAVLNKHKKTILPKTTIMVDGQWLSGINWMKMKDLEAGLDTLSTSVFRVRPWFEPGIWGGQWIKSNIDGINKDVINYAWSFELIVPENGLVFESDGNLLEVSFDTLMFRNSEKILGTHAGRFGDEFPIRFDFLDTVKGGNLSIQCHPRLKYIQDVFGEHITQDETYYILDCEPKANVYLGFQEDIDPAAYRKALEDSQANGEEIDITKFVQSHPAKKHDLFLIPNSTVHSAGSGNLVLEISATPYIFTFKMYDWVRLDLEGNPRSINIEHAFNNLDFERKGKRVQQELISKPAIIEKGEDWELLHLPTHAGHFYDVHRIDFNGSVNVETNASCHVLMLVEGEAVLVETADGKRHQYAYAETFVIPAAAVAYKLTSIGKESSKVIKAFLKD